MQVRKRVPKVHASIPNDQHSDHEEEEKEEEVESFLYSVLPRVKGGIDLKQRRVEAQLSL